MNDGAVGGRSSETQSNPIDIASTAIDIVFYIGRCLCLRARKKSSLSVEYSRVIYSENDIWGYTKDSTFLRDYKIILL
jgi:hypothetical protein